MFERMTRATTLRAPPRRAALATWSCIAMLLSVVGLPGAHAAARSSRSCGNQVVWRTQRDGTQVCPRTHSILAGTSWIMLRWRGWGSPVARANGYQLDYPPAPGTDGRSPLILRLYKRLDCPDGTRIYSRVSVSVRYRRAILPTGPLLQRSHYRVFCSGLTGSGGGG